MNKTKKQQIKMPLRPKSPGSLLIDPDEQFGRIQGPCVKINNDAFNRPGCRRICRTEDRVRHRIHDRSEERARSKSRDRAKKTAMKTGQEAGDKIASTQDEVTSLEDVDIDQMLSGDWNLFDEIAQHFRQSNEYGDLVHIFDKQVIDAPRKATKQEEILDQLTVAGEHMGQFGEKLEVCETGLKVCTNDLAVFREDILELGMVHDTQVQQQKKRHTRQTNEIKTLEKSVEKISGERENMMKKLSLINQAETNDAIIDAYQRFNAMLTELKVATQKNKKTVENWNINTTHVAQHIRMEMKMFEARNANLETDMRKLFAEHQRLMSLLSSGDHSKCREKVLQKKQQGKARDKVEWKPNPRQKMPDERHDWRKSCHGKSLYGKKDLEETVPDWEQKIKEMRQMAMHDSLCHKHQPDGLQQPYTMDREWKKQHPEWEREKQQAEEWDREKQQELRDLQPTSLMLEPIDMYRDEHSLQLHLTSDKAKGKAAKQVKVTMDENEYKMMKYREWFEEDFRQRRSSLKERIQQMSTKIQGMKDM
ncbi:golgin subfamily A member 6-like protein 2 [Gigantopelta aegis]|uniref:golgin subfamily A member 6-like protein 2 n=1 Tax=Gigantopelta aegis TaxID=1735272 RepID=UPI001B88C838|nr:golgin subfamily A member 6-like protein 2 [Gigantopelta aegis]